MYHFLVIFQFYTLTEFILGSTVKDIDRRYYCTNSYDFFFTAKGVYHIDSTCNKTQTQNLLLLVIVTWWCEDLRSSDIFLFDMILCFILL